MKNIDKAIETLKTLAICDIIATVGMILLTIIYYNVSFFIQYGKFLGL